VAAAGGPGRLPTALDVTAYRLVQEALTNVLKHSASPTATVSIGCDEQGLVVEVTDEGPHRAHSTAHDPLSTGHGLVGMRERVALFGGRLEAAPAGSGWRVRAELPMTRVPAPR
jgi:signal transduction histidine kinase